ncbi:hypothetical protein PG994_003350 [Apiospora phragmitis]|uniref:Uncharacterized protein n=1 Tax=Apiospora phragmitis TaxID=2905665 RepID=A0ABR1VXW8_9PEZI
MDRVLCWRSEHSHLGRKHLFPSWSRLDWIGMPVFPEVLNIEGDRRITKYEYDAAKRIYKHGTTEPLKVTTILAYLPVDDIEEGDYSCNTFCVWSPNDGSLVGQIQLSNQWRRERPPREPLAFIPILSTARDNEELRIEMLMCIQRVWAIGSGDYDTKKAVFERVQVMDCDITEGDWKRLATCASADGDGIFLI